MEQVADLGGLGGNQPRAAANGPSAVYFNPALLDDVPAGFTLGVLVLRTDIGVRVGSRGTTGRYDVPDGLQNATHEDGSRLEAYPIATSLLRDGRPATDLMPAFAARSRQSGGSGQSANTYEAVGLVAKVFRQRLTLGFYGLFPNAPFMQLRSFYSDEREQYFSNSIQPELYADRMTAISFSGAASYRLHETLSLGLGATLSFAATVDAPVFVADAGRLQEVLIDTNARVSMAASPHLGIAYRPHSRLRFTGTVHAPQRNDLDISFKFLLATGLEQGSTMRYTQNFQPWQLGVGAAFDLLARKDDTLMLTAALLYGRWSQYDDRVRNTPSGEYAWRDTFTPSAGLSYRAQRFGLSADFQYKPTPVPLQTGRTNYMDNDRLGVSLTAELRWQWWDTPMRWTLMLQGQRMLERYQQKRVPRGDDAQLVRDEVPDDAEISGRPVAGRDGLQTNNPGWPGFSSSGFVASAGTTIALQW